MTVSARPNADTDPRSAKVTISCGAVMESFTVIQAAAPPKAIEVNNITLSREYLTLKVGESATLLATVSPEDATERTIVWKSSDQSIAIVTDGRVDALSPGTVAIMAQAGTQVAVCIVTVDCDVIPVTGISLNRAKYTLEEGGTLELKATVYPADATDKTVTWSSSDATVASVDDVGVVTALKEGVTSITARAGEKSVSCVLTVKKRVITVTAISLDKNRLDMMKGESVILVATVIPEDASDKTVIWSSSNSAVATVDNIGMVVAVGEGEATITAMAGGMSATCNVSVTKRPGSFFSVKPTNVSIPAEGGSFTVAVTCNEGEYQIIDKSEWIEEVSVAILDDSNKIHEYTVSVNTTGIDRSGIIVFCNAYNECESVYVTQPSTGYYISTDFSYDGTVKTLQEATVGAGINLVFMGDAFSDRQIADGTYLSVMKKMMEAFFSEEPYKSLRAMFNAYAVFVVSETEGYEHEGRRLSTWFSEGTQVGGNDFLCMDYARNIIPEDKMEDVLITVAMNSSNFGGTCYMYWPSSVGVDYGKGTSVAYFPVGTDDETLSALVHHEAGGHGFAKLADEYSYDYMGEMPQEQKDVININVPNGWWKNCDFTNDPVTVKWHHFLEDSRYQYDGLGCYEGAFTYWTGTWRSTDFSIMRYNTGGFNAPSREAIWYRAHKLAYGEGWEYDYEEFATYDAINRKTAVSAAAQRRHSLNRYLPPTHPPVVINHPWNATRP